MHAVNSAALAPSAHQQDYTPGMTHTRKPHSDEEQSERKFRYHGKSYDLLRFNPNANAQGRYFGPHKPVTVTLPILNARVCVDAGASISSQGLIYVLVTDETKELFGIWCFAEDIAFHE